MRPMPVTMPAAWHLVCRRGRGGELRQFEKRRTGVEQGPTRSRGKSLPRARCLARASSPPPAAIWSILARKSSTRADIAPALIRNSAERALRLVFSVFMADGSKNGIGAGIVDRGRAHEKAIMATNRRLPDGGDARADWKPRRGSRRAPDSKMAHSHHRPRVDFPGCVCFSSQPIGSIPVIIIRRFALIGLSEHNGRPKKPLAE